MDLGHIRDVADFTKYVFDQIFASSGAAINLRTAHGEARIKKPILFPQWLDVARSIAFDDSVAYEIFTYDQFGSPGGHNSSFSPEDLPSNLLGTIVAGRAITAGTGVPFNAAVTTALAALFAGAVAQRPSETQAAFALINGCWIDFKGVMSVFLDPYLRRRNFTFVPWKAGHPSDTTTPALMTAGFGSAPTLYDYVFTNGRNIFRSDFPTEIARIRADAKVRYGPNFDKPVPCP